MTTEELLAQTAKEIQARGWCQGIQQHQDGRVCTMGAFYFALKYFGWNTDFNSTPDIMKWHDSEAYSSYSKAIDRVHEITGRTSIPGWNDDPETTQEDVLLVLKKAAFDY